MASTAANGDTVAVGAGLRWFFRLSAGLALIAGIQLFVLAGETDRFFSWTIEPPLTAAFMGAAYWAALVLLAWAARQRAWTRARAALAPVFLIAVFLLVATLINLDRFHHDLFGRFWIAVYVLVTPLLAYLVWRQGGRAALAAAAGGIPLPGWVRAALLIQAAPLLVVGGALFVAPLDADSVWPWTLSQLTAQVVASFLIGFGAAAALAAWENNAADRLGGAALAYVTLAALELAAVAIHSGDVDGGAVEVVAYVAFWVSALGVGLWGSLALRRSRLGIGAAHGRHESPNA